MSEREIRSLLRKVCADLDRVARKAVLPTTLGASLALTSCSGTPKTEVTPDPIHTDGVHTLADADAGAHTVESPPPDPIVAVDAALVQEPAPVKTDAAPVRVKVRTGPQKPDPPKPYMAPDAEYLYEAIQRNRTA